MGHDRGKIVLWDIAGAGGTTVWSGRSAAVISLAFSADGRRLASGGSDGGVRILQVQQPDAGLPFMPAFGKATTLLSILKSADGRAKPSSILATDQHGCTRIIDRTPKRASLRA